MNRKGFTLIELLAVMVIIALLLLVTVPTINNLISDSKGKMFNNNINAILDGANDWAYEHAELLPNKNLKINITLAQLKSGGYVNLNIKNPKTGDLFNNDMVITITNVGKTNTDLNKAYSKYNGDYLFSIDLKSGTTTIYDEDAPLIVLKGDIVTYVELNSSFTDLGCEAFTSSGSDITSNVTKIIKNGNGEGATIEVTDFNVYYIEYSVNDNGKTSTMIRTVIVRDTTPPEILLPANNNISISDTTYNLDSDVTCEDNSDSCNITHEGTITFGKTGKYVIKYTASDGSGNTSRKKRVITVQ